MRRTLALVAAVPLAAAACAGASAGPLPGGFRQIGSGPAGGQVWRGIIPGGSRPSMVYLPPGYDPARRYPVVYLLHGFPGSPWSYVKSLSLAALADTLVARREASPFLAVIPAGGPTAHYRGEWTGSAEDYVVDSVVPWVDANLPADAVPAARTLAGLSAGGYGAVDIGLRHPGTFGRLESWGGYFRPFRDGTLKHADAAELARHDPWLLVGTQAAQLRRAGVRFFLSSGEGHGAVTPAATASFARHLRALHLPYRLELLRAGGPMWERQVADGVRWATRASA